MTAFIKVISDEVAMYGATGAIVLAHIRFRTAYDGPGRMERDGHRWWRVTHQDLGLETGLSAKAVRGALSRLGEAVAAEHYSPLSDQSRAYRVAEAREVLTSQKTTRAGPDRPTDRTGSPDALPGISNRPARYLQSPGGASVPFAGRVEDRGEAPSPSDPPQNELPVFPNHCPEHRHQEFPGPCGGCKRANDAAKAQAAADALAHDTARKARRAKIDACSDCDDYGRDDDLAPCDHAMVQRSKWSTIR